MAGPDVSSYLYVLILLFVSSNHIRIVCGQEPPGGNDGNLMEPGNNEGQFTQPGGSGRPAMQPAMNQRQPLRPGDSGVQSIQSSGNVGQSMQPSERRVPSVQPGLNWRQPKQSSGNWGPQMQPGGKEGQSTSPSDNRKPQTQFGWNQGQSGQQGGAWRPPMQIGGTGVRQMQPGGNGPPQEQSGQLRGNVSPMRPEWNNGQSRQPGGNVSPVRSGWKQEQSGQLGGNWPQPMQTGGTGGSLMKPVGNVGQPLPSGGIWRPPMEIKWNARPAKLQSGSGGNTLPQSGFPVRPNTVENKNQSDPLTKDEKIKNIFKLVSRNLNYQRVPRTVLLLGNPGSGKTTLALLLSGDYNLTQSRDEYLTYFFEDPFGRIGNRTTYPEEFMSPKNTSFYDWPPHGQNMDKEEVEIAYVSRANEAYESIESFRILLVLRQCYVPYKNCTIEEKITTSYPALINLARLLTNFEWYKDSVGIVYNKVCAADGNPATERELYALQLQEVLEGVIKLALEEIKETKDPNVRDYLERTVEFADMLKADEKIAVFPTPNQLLDQPIYDQNILRGFRETDKLLKSLDCTVKRESLYHPMSSEVESTVEELKEYTTKNAAKSVSKSFRTVEVELRRQGAKFFGIHERKDFYIPRRATLENVTSSIRDSTTLAEFLISLSEITKQLNLSFSFSQFNEGLRHMGYYTFFAGLSGSKPDFDGSAWYESFANLSQSVSGNAGWYDFVVDLYESFSEEGFQKNKALYNVSNIEQSWGKGPEGNGLQITEENFSIFFSKAAELFPSLARHLAVNTTNPSEEQITEINIVVEETVRSVTVTFCSGTRAITKGSFVFLNENTWKTYNGCSDAQEVLIFGFNKIFAGGGGSISSSHKLVLISPVIEVSGLQISQNGEESPGQQPPYDWWVRQTGPDCFKNLENGKPGKPGQIGKQPNETFVASSQISGDGRLVIQSIGGLGGYGQHGQPVIESCTVPEITECDFNKTCHSCVPHRDCNVCLVQACDLEFELQPQLKYIKLCSEQAHLSYPISVGGAAGLGNFPGDIILVTRENNPAIQTSQFHGKKGYGGYNNIIRFELYLNGKEVWLPEICGGLTPTGIGYQRSIGEQPKPNVTLTGNPTYKISTFREHSFKVLNLANVHFLKTLWNFVSSQEGKTNLFDSKGFAFETKTVLPLWIPAKVSPIQEQFYTTYLFSAAERINKFIKTRTYKHPRLFCGHDPDTSEYDPVCTECHELPCKTRLVEAPKDLGLEPLKALASLLTSINSQLVNIKRQHDNTLVTDIDSFMDLTYERIEDYKKNKDMAESAMKMREANEKYRENINKKIDDASNIIKTQLQPEIDSLNKLVESEVDAIIGKIKELIEQAKKNKEELQKHRDQAQRALIVHSVFGGLSILGGIVGLFGPVGAAVGGAISAGAGAANALYDAVEGTPPLDRVKQVGKETSESNNKMETFLKQHQAEKLKHVDDLFNEAQTIFDSNSTILSNLRKDFTEKRAQYDLLKSSGNPDFEKMRQIRNEIRVIFEQVGKSGKTAHASTALVLKKEDKPENPWKDRFETLGKGLKIVEDSANLYTKLKGDSDAIQECDNAISAVDKQIENFRKMEDYANSCIRPMVSDVQDLSKKYASGELQDDSLAQMDVAGWKMQSSINELREQLQDFAGAMGIDSSGVVSALKKLSDVMKLVSDIYARMGAWNEQRELGDYMYTLAVAAKGIDIKDKELLAWVTEVSLIAQRTSVLWFYQKALNALIQFSFPMAHRLQPYMQIPITNNNIDDYIDEIQKNFKSLREELKLEKAVVGGGQDEFRRRDMFYDTHSSTPFAFFDAEEHHNAVLTLFDQESTTLFADILDFELPYDAVKFYVVDVIFRVREGEPESEKKDAELQNALSFYSISLTHTGNNYFRFDGKFYVLQTPSLRIVYNYLKSNGEVNGKNAIYEKLEKGDETLSPYTLWEVKLTKLKDDNGADLTPFRDLKIDMLLCGMGTYIHQEIYETGEEFFTENYYMPDETLGNIARNKLKEDARALSGNRLLRVVKRGGGYQVVTSEETKKLNPHLLSRPTPFFESEMLSPNIHKNWDNATVTSGYYHQARR